MNRALTTPAGQPWPSPGDLSGHPQQPPGPLGLGHLETTMNDDHTPLLDRLRATLTMAQGGHAIITADSLPPPREGGAWDGTALALFGLAKGMAAQVGAHAICHNTGDGWVFGWESDDPRDDPTESLEPLLPLDWWPGPDVVWGSELEALGFVEV